MRPWPFVEKVGVPRYKTCGGGVVGRTSELLPAGVAGTVERQCYVAELNLADVDLRFVVKRTGPIVSMTMLADLDHRLASTAQNTGATLLIDCAVLDVSPGAVHIDLWTTKGVLRAQFVIAADGENSLISRRLAWPDGRVLLAGDAVDLVTGEGFTFAIRSSQVAAQSLLDGSTHATRIHHAYHLRISETILPELRAGRFLTRLRYCPTRTRNTLFQLHGQKLSEAMSDVVVGKRRYMHILRLLEDLKLFRFWDRAVGPWHCAVRSP